MKIFYDTEFIDDGRTINLISIGMIREDDLTYYAISSEFDPSKASDWVKENVLNQLGIRILEDGPPRYHTPTPKSRKQIAEEIEEFVGIHPTFIAYFADYDHVVLSQLYGPMMNLPKTWPYYTWDLKQEMDRLINHLPHLSQDSEGEHNALTDACWVKAAYEHVQTFKIRKGIR